VSEPHLLDAAGVAKRFGAVTALSDAALTVSPGEIVALMGANGAGKSTLIKILTGALAADSGTIRIRGHARRITSPAAARAAGMMPVYQEPALIPDLDIADNLKLSATPAGPFLARAEALGISDLDLSVPAGRLPLATLRVLDLARALAVEPDILILDEMTAALPSDLVERVLDVLRAEAAAGRGVVFISHRFPEISVLCHRATVLRDGRSVGSVPIEPGVEERVVEMMLGERMARAHAGAAGRAPSRRPAREGVPQLRVEALAVGRKLADVSFELRAGEVLGVVALEGQGQDELFEVLAGFERPRAGGIEVRGRTARFRHPADAIGMGHALVPGDRAEALLMQRPVRENIALPAAARPAHWGPIDMRDERRRVARAIEALQIDTRAGGEVRRLSGGNQQKVTLARWIAAGVQTLLCFDPTRGIDIRTKHQIYPLLRELAAEGTAVLLYTSDLEEVQLVCDRAVVIFAGRVVDEIDAAEADQQTLMRAVHGLGRLPAAMATGEQPS